MMKTEVTKMTKKILIPVVLVLLVSMLAGGVALAQSGGNPAQPGTPATISNLARGLAARLAPLRNAGAIGQVDTVSQSQLIIRNLSGGQHTYQLDAQTRYLDENGQPATAQELVSRRWVLVQATRSGITNWIARTVYLLPASFNPPEDLNLLVAGQLSSANTTAGTFSLQARSGQEWTFALGQGAVFLGQTKSLSALEPGMQVMVAGIKAAQGSSPSAYLVFARQPQAQVNNYDLRLVGRIVSVNGDALVVENLRGWQYNLQLTADTRYTGRLTSASDLQVGMYIALGANKVNGVYQVQAILAPQRNRAIQPAPAATPGPAA
jgi:Domain of unknown function (DUF5666)